jgi:AraC-like DNA-binding protein
VRSASLQQALDREARTEDPRRSFLALLYDQLLASVHVNPGLERSALHFGISPATLKRRLAAHGTHFQAELDQVRLHVALRLMHCRGFDNDAVGRHLGIVDPTNFRRSVKRWSGLTPSLLRAALPSAWSA